MKPFNKAILKLTTIYTSILLIICLGFSLTIYSTSKNNFLKEPPHIIFRSEIRENTRIAIRNRDLKIQQEILSSLIFINIIILSTGAIASYFLARWTLKPIQKNMNEQTEFIANASHELRTPLTALRMENEVILRDKFATKIELENQIQSNLEEINKLQTLTDRLLKISLDDTLELKPTNILQVANIAISHNLAQAKSKNITIKIDIPKNQTLPANKPALTEILSILIENAIKYSPKNTEITITHKNNEILIIDQGPGINEADLPHIFKRFYRAEKSHTSEGYGLGLSLATHLAEKQNLQITAKNNPKKGATFIIQP